MDDKKSIVLTDSLTPVPVNVTVDHVDAQSTQDAHINADALVLTSNLVLLMQVWPRLETLDQICKLSDQVIKVLTSRRELCLKPTSRAETDGSDIPIVPIR